MPNLRVLLQVQRGLLFKYGWLRAWWKGKPVDANGEPIPWITYPAIEFLSQFDFSDASVFEWGSGFSTLWWSKRCRAIATVESNAPWIPYIRPLLPERVEFLTTSPDVEAEIEILRIHKRQTWDVIVIDNHGPFRWRCAEAATTHLAEGGIIILDNSDQCLKAANTLRMAGLTEIDFSGFIPGSGYGHTTSVFFNQSIRFQTLMPQPNKPVSQPNPPWPKC